MANRNETESVRLGKDILVEIRKVAGREKRTIRGQIEWLINIGLAKA